MTLPQRTLAVVGANYENKNPRSVGRKFEITMCKPSEMVQLVPEPKNPADENAIAVYSARNYQIGYLTAERAPFIKKLLARGETVRAVFQEATKWGCYIRVSFDGSMPVVPMPEEGSVQVSDPEPDWYPDEEWPD